MTTLIATATVTAVVGVIAGYAFRQLISVFTAAQAQWAAERRNMHADWQKERRELLTRIQHPEHVPYEPGQAQEIPENEIDESNLVGNIHWDDAYFEEESEDLQYVGD